jgi:hypothetical protein
MSPDKRNEIMTQTFADDAPPPTEFPNGSAGVILKRLFDIAENCIAKSKRLKE